MVGQRALGRGRSNQFLEITQPIRLTLVQRVSLTGVSASFNLGAKLAELRQFPAEHLLSRRSQRWAIPNLGDGLRSTQHEAATVSLAKGRGVAAQAHKPPDAGRELCPRQWTKGRGQF